MFRTHVCCLLLCFRGNSGPVQTPLHSFAQPKWWIYYGKRAAFELIWYRNFSFGRLKRQARQSLSHYSTLERHVIHTALLSSAESNVYIMHTLNLKFFSQYRSILRSYHAQNTKLRKMAGKEEQSCSCCLKNTKYTCLRCQEYFCMPCSVFENDETVKG